MSLVNENVSFFFSSLLEVESVKGNNNESRKNKQTKREREKMKQKNKEKQTTRSLEEIRSHNILIEHYLFSLSRAFSRFLLLQVPENYHQKRKKKNERPIDNIIEPNHSFRSASSTSSSRSTTAATTTRNIPTFIISCRIVECCWITC